MAITPPTRTAGSLGTTKSNAQPVTNEPQQLSAPQYNVCADNLIAVINQSNANEAAIAGAGGGIASYGTWDYDPTTSAAGIAAGEIRFSGANPTTSGIMYIHKTNLQGFDMSSVLSELRSWRMSFISTDGTELLTVFVSNIFDTGAHYTFQITQQAGSAALTNDFVFTVSPIAPAAFEIPQGGTYALGNWDWLGSTVVADPGAGNLNMSSSSPGSATALYISVINDTNGVDFIEPFQDLQVGDFILLRSDSDAYGVRYVIDAPPIDNGTWFNIPVAVQSAGGSIGSTQPMRMVIIKSSVAAAASNVLWEWNGVDATQFGTPFIVSTNTPGTLAGSLVVEPGVISPQPNQLRLDGTGQGVSGEHYIVVPILQSLPQSFEVVINSLTMSAQSINTGFAFFFWGDLTGSGHGYIWHPQQRSNRLDNGTLISGNVGLLNMSNGSGNMRFRVEGRNDVDYPHGMVTFDFLSIPTARLNKSVRNAFDATDGDWNFATLPPGSWAGTSADRFGIAMLTTGNLSAPDWSLNSIKINKI